MWNGGTRQRRPVRSETGSTISHSKSAVLRPVLPPSVPFAFFFSHWVALNSAQNNTLFAFSFYLLGNCAFAFVSARASSCGCCCKEQTFSVAVSENSAWINERNQLINMWLWKHCSRFRSECEEGWPVGWQNGNRSIGTSCGVQTISSCKWNKQVIRQSAPTGVILISLNVGIHHLGDGLWWM